MTQARDRMPRRLVARAIGAMLRPVQRSIPLVGVPSRPVADRKPEAATRAVAIWLLLCCVMILAMVVIGGVTRLTESGLSITEWRPVSGALPPLSDADWQDAFARYQ